jgi:hypothetical protein
MIIIQVKLLLISHISTKAPDLVIEVLFRLLEAITGEDSTAQSITQQQGLHQQDQSRSTGQVQEGPEYRKDRLS